MIDITVFQNSKQEYRGVVLSGHAEFAEYGNDIICASVSVLAINMANSIDTFTKDSVECKMVEDTGYFSLHFLAEISLESKLLMSSFILGIKEIQNSYGESYIKIRFKEV